MDKTEMKSLMIQLSERLDSKLEPILGSDLPQLQLRPASELNVDLVRARNQRYERLTGSPPNIFRKLLHWWERAYIPTNSTGFFHAEIPDTIYYSDVNPHLQNHSLYNPDRMLAHEVVHARILSRDVMQSIEDAGLERVLRAHPLWRTIQEGVANCLGYQIANQKGREGFDKFIATARKWSEKPGRDPVHVKQMEPHYYGFLFMKAVTEQLGEQEAIRLALNPLNSQLDSFVLTLDEIKKPEQYIQRRKVC